MATTDLYPLFSSPVMTMDHDNIQLVDAIQYCKTNLEYMSNKGGNFTSLNTDVFSLDVFSEIKDLALEAIRVYTKEIMKWSDGPEFFITQSWVNKNPTSTTHHEHYHLNTLFSGVFYLDTAEPDYISFFTSKQPFFKFFEDEKNIWNSDRYDLLAKPGRFVIFPANMLHSVGENIASHERISVAFNVFVKGQLGRRENLTYLEL
jgi:uncharacterized protein (TIGR02466 family)